MRFKHNQLVRLKDSNLMGRVSGFCHYTRYNSEVVHEGVLVNLVEGFYDPAKQSFISIMVCQEDTLEEYD
jgi:hypothetical protein